MRLVLNVIWQVFGGQRMAAGYQLAVSFIPLGKQIVPVKWPTRFAAVPA